MLTPSRAEAQLCGAGCAGPVWSTFGGHDYYYCPTTNARTWTSARDTCWGTTDNAGANFYLARPESAGENGHIAGNLAGVTRWIGANDLNSERGAATNLWSFATNTNTGGGTAAFTQWQPGEPNNYYVVGQNGTCPYGGASGAGEDCVEMYTSGNWNDAACFCDVGANTPQRPFACEGGYYCGNGLLAPTGEQCDDGNRTSGDGCSSTCTIEAGYVCDTTTQPTPCAAACLSPARSALGDTVYTYCNGTPTNWNLAAAYCNTIGGSLVQIDSAEEQYHLVSSFNMGSETWIGANDVAVANIWRWTGSGSQFYNEGTTAQSGYMHWNAGEPNNSGQCGIMYASGQDWRWDDTPCTGTNRRFICEMNNICGDGFKRSTESCDDGGAAGGCNVGCTADTTTCGNGRINAGETCDDGGLVAGDGCSSTCQIERGFVCPGAPNSGGACVNACTPAARLFFSRYPMTLAQQTAEAAAQGATGVQSSASTTEYLSCNVATNAMDAERRCESFGTNWRLARTNSAFENTLLGTVVNATFFIGATDEFTESTFLWRDGTAVTPFWQGGQPSNSAPGEDCVVSTASGLWNDQRCLTNTRFVCEGPGFCGNGAVSMPEECDDNNTVDTDSCSNSCIVRFGHACLLPGGNGDAAPVVASCPRGASCCYAIAQAVLSGVRLVGGELEWTTTAEAGTLGFYVSAQRGNLWEPLHNGLLPSLPEAGEGAVYRLRASGIRGRTIRIEEHDARGRGLTLFEGVPAVASGPSRLGGQEFLVTANSLTGAAEMPEDAAPSAAGRRKAAGDEPTGVFALASGDGLLRVTFAEIAAALEVPAATVAARVEAGELSVTEHGNVVGWTRAEDDGDAIVFVARRRESVYSATRPYEIRLGAGAQLVAVDRSMDDVPTGEGQLRFHHEVDSFPALAVSPDPTQEFWFERSVGNHSSFQDYPATFTLDNVDGQAATFDLSYYAAPGLSADNALTLTMTINGQAAGAFDVTSTGLGVARFTIPAGALLAGPNTVQIRASSTLPAGQALAYVDAYQVTYGAALEFGSQGRFEATETGALSFELDNTSNTPVWIVDTTTGERVSATRTDIDGARARFTIDAQDNHEYFVASDAGLLAPTALRARSEQNFADSSRAADYVVIAPTALFDAATALVARRQTQGLSATAVDVQDIYDAYGAGEHDPYAIREFLRVAQGWSTAPRYVLLLGDGNYDYRGVRPTGSGSIPPMMIQTETGVFASDFALGDLDGDDRPDIAIGRVPAHTAAEADAFVQRVVTYESGDLDAFARHALLVSGNNREIDFTGNVNTLQSQLDSRVNAERINRAALTLADARAQLIEGINTGSFWFHYQGHGASNQLDDDGLLTLSDVAALTNSDALTIFTGMSCSTARFEVPGMDSIAELMLNGSPGGAIAMFGPSGGGRTYESANIAESFQRALLTGNNLTSGRMGDVVLGLYDPATGANASTAQLAVYLLLGDPATKLPDRSRLAPPVVVDPPEEDGGVTVPEGDAGRRPDAGRPVTPPGGMGGGACTVSVTSGTDLTGGLVLLLGLVLGLGRRARRRKS